MMTIILNAVGLFGGMIINETVMYVVFGISFLSYFMKYSKVAWKIIYERVVESSGEVEAKIVNSLSIIFLMIWGYWLLCREVRNWVITIVIAQAIIFQIFEIRDEEDPGAVKVLIGFVLELLLAIVLCLK